MSISHQSELVPISEIQVLRDKRQRRGELEIETLAESIKRNGLISPIVLTRERILVAGERRLTACQSLGMLEIPARYIEDISGIDLQIVELEENIKRKDLEWQDIVRGVATIHQLYLAKDPEWTMSETARECGLTHGTISMYLRVHSELESNKRVAEAGAVREAYNQLKRKDSRLAGEALDELIGEAPAPLPVVPSVVVEKSSGTDGTTEVYHKVNTKTGKREEITKVEATKIAETVISAPALFSGILNESFLEWAPRYAGPKFNLIHCDFPYGVNLFDGPQGRGAEPTSGYTDTAEVYDQLIESLCANLDRLMSLSGHLMFWLSADTKIVSETIAKFNKLAPSLAFHKFPLIWFKSDNAGIASDPTHGPRHVYEACLLASRSKRQIVRVKSDAHSAPTDKRLHPSTKPEPVLRHFFEMFVDENTLMLDPTCGSGASLRAAESLGARHTLGLEIDPDFAKAASDELKRHRILRLAASKSK